MKHFLARALVLVGLLVSTLGHAAQYPIAFVEGSGPVPVFFAGG